MVWWQIVLILLVAIIIGVSVGLFIDYLIRRFQRKRVTNSVDGGNGHQASLKLNGNSHEPAAGLIPLLSRRSVIVLSIGLIVGAGLGMGYWVISPLSFGTSSAASLPGGDASSPVYESRVSVMVSAPSAAYVDVKDRSRQAEYWQTKFDSPAFLEFLSQEITEQGLSHSYTSTELSHLLSSRFDGTSPEFQIIVRSHNEKEVDLLASVVPNVFKDYLIAEEKTAYQSQYDETQIEFNRVKTGLSVARSQLNAMIPPDLPLDPQQDPTYIVASAKVAALEKQLQDLFVEVASSVANGQSETEYQDTLIKIDRVSAALAEARSALNRSQLRIEANRNSVNQDPAYVLASARVETLTTELASLASNLASSSMESSQQPEVLRLFDTSQPSTTTVVPPDKIRRRDVLLMGGILGMGLAWVGLNFKGLLSMVRSPSVNVAKREEDEKSVDLKIGAGK
jgi:hypothetical protein